MLIISLEKEELVNLVLIHVNNNTIPDSNSNRSSSQYSEDNFSNPFDQIKQTCQNLFTTFTDKIASGETQLIEFLFKPPLFYLVLYISYSDLVKCLYSIILIFCCVNVVYFQLQMITAFGPICI